MNKPGHPFFQQSWTTTGNYFPHGWWWRLGQSGSPSAATRRVCWEPSMLLGLCGLFSTRFNSWSRICFGSASVRGSDGWLFRGLNGADGLRPGANGVPRAIGPSKSTALAQWVGGSLGRGEWPCLVRGWFLQVTFELISLNKKRWVSAASFQGFPARESTSPGERPQVVSGRTKICPKTGPTG